MLQDCCHPPFTSAEVDSGLTSVEAWMHSILPQSNHIYIRHENIGILFFQLLKLVFFLANVHFIISFFCIFTL